MKLTPKLSILILVAAFLPTAIVGYLAYDNGRRTIIKETIKHLVSNNLFKSNDLTRWVEDCQGSLEELAQRPLVRLYAESLMKHEAQGRPDQKVKVRLLEEHLKPRLKYGHFLEVFLVCPKHGLTLVSTDERQEGKYKNHQTYYLEGKSRTYTQHVYYAPGLEQTFTTASTPIKDNQGNLLGILAGHLDLGELSKIIEQQPVKSRTEDTYLVNAFNFFVTEPRFGRGNALKKIVHTEGVEAGLAGQSGTGFYQDYREQPVIGAYLWLPEFKMVLLTEIGQEEAFAPVVHLLWTISLIAVGVSVMAGLVALFFARTLTRPIRRLAAGAEEIGQGNLEFRVGTDVQDEIGQLSRVFDRMMESLKKTTVSRNDLLEEIEKRELAEELLRATSARQEALLTAVPDIIMEVDANKVYTWANQPGFDFFGDDLIGKTADFYFEGEQTVYEIVQPIFDGGENVIYVESWQRRKDGQKRLLAWWCRVLKDTAGNVTGALSSARDITEHKIAEETILRERDFTQAVIDSMPGLFYLFDDQGRFLRWNKNIEKVSGYSAEEISHLSPLDLFEGPDQGLVGQVIQQVFMGGEADVEAEFLSKDQTKIPCFFTGRLFRFDQKPCLIGMGIDITERKRAAEALREIHQELEKRNEEMTRFIYAVSHDLKSPLVTIKTFLGYLVQDAQNQNEEQMDQDLTYIRTATDKMSQLLDELLDLSRVGRMIRPPVETPLQGIVQEALDLVAGQTVERGAQIQVTEEPVVLYGDRPRLVEVFQNLVDNAVKFMGDQPNPRVEIGVEGAGEGLVLFVRDNGIGIDQRHQPKLFGLFEKLDPRTEGTGIGLSLVQRIVEVHGGRIWVESEGIGKGACFRFTLAHTKRQSI